MTISFLWLRNLRGWFSSRILSDAVNSVIAGLFGLAVVMHLIASIFARAWGWPLAISFFCLGVFAVQGYFAPVSPYDENALTGAAITLFVIFFIVFLFMIALTSRVNVAFWPIALSTFVEGALANFWRITRV